MSIVALCGGVGGAKLADGLAAIVPGEALTIVVNTGDDFEHLGLAISPDIDTVVYTLAGLADTERGWGVAGESWQAMAMLGRLGEADWFRLGDRDLAMHIARTRRLRAGEPLSAITADVAARLGIAARIVPMSDDPVRTRLTTDAGELDFQDYFVARQCRPAVSALSYRGAEAALPAPALAGLGDAAVDAIILCPSNPFLSIDPLLGLPGVAAALERATAPRVAVSPIVGGAAIKGPLAKMMGELGLPVSIASIARHYRGKLDGLVIDPADAALRPEIEGLGIAVLVAPAIMRTRADRVALARTTLAFAETLRAGGGSGCGATESSPPRSDGC